MSNEWLIAWWENLFLTFVVVLAVADICMIVFIAGLAVIERILRRTLLRDPLDWRLVAERVRAIRKEQL